MLTWEYKTDLVYDYHLTMSEVLNSHGKDGWELVTVTEYRPGGSKCFVFKRPAKVPTPSKRKGR